MKTATKALALVLIATLLLSMLTGCGLLRKPEYTVTFDPNGGELVSGSLTQTVKKGESAVPPQLKNGRQELSWSGSWDNITENTTITAQWTKVPMDTSELAAYVQERTVTVNVSTLNGGGGTGSGFFIDSNGTIVTNFHVIDLAAEITVEAGSGASYPVERIVDFSNVYDMAILKIDMTNSPYLELATDAARTGDKVFAVGSALGELTGTFTAGIVSSTKRSYGMIDCIQMDAAISPGNSGGPLVNEYGEVVGINTASYVNGENLNLAIKIDQLSILNRDKNWTVREFKEWYEQESSRSWSPVRTDNSGQRHYYYSLVNTYGQITGAACIYSVDETSSGLDVHDGYLDMYDFYVYDYNSSQYDQYVEYLKSVGFEYQESEVFGGGTSYYYYNDKDEILVDLFIKKDFSQIYVYPKRQ